MNILIVEDDLNLAETLKQIMEKEKYIVDVAYDGQDGLFYASNSTDYDIIILDVMMPKLNGYEVIKSLRQKNISTPTLMLTAKSEISDKITGLDYGADDYMTKPFVPEELLARVRALTRRQGDVILNEIKFEKLTLNLSTYVLSYDLKSLTLSNKEFQIMNLFMLNPHMILSKENIIMKIWGIESDAEDNNVEAYISFLRKKLVFLNANVAIHTIRKAGYKLEKTND